MQKTPSFCPALGWRPYQDDGAPTVDVGDLASYNDKSTSTAQIAWTDKPRLMLAIAAKPTSASAQARVVHLVGVLLTPASADWQAAPISPTARAGGRRPLPRSASRCPMGARHAFTTSASAGGETVGDVCGREKDPADRQKRVIVGEFAVQTDAGQSAVHRRAQVPRPPTIVTRAHPAGSRDRGTRPRSRSPSRSSSHRATARGPGRGRTAWPALGQHHVGGFDVAVHQAGLVQRLGGEGDAFERP